MKVGRAKSICSVRDSRLCQNWGYFVLVMSLVALLGVGRAKGAAGDLYATTGVRTTGDLNLIYRYDSASKRTTFASSRNLRYYGIAFDHQGSAFVSSHSTGTIEKYAVDGSRVTFASGMIGPTGLAIDGADQVFVADSLGHAI